MANEKILVVDDEEYILELISFNLTNNGYTVLTANNGIDAVKIASSSSRLVTESARALMDEIHEAPAYCVEVRIM